MNRAFIILFFVWNSSITNGIAQIPEYIYLNANGKLNGIDETILVKKYGPPTYELIQPRYKYIGEENIEIERTYRSTNPQSRNVSIKKSLWHINKDFDLTAWLHYYNGKWIVICYSFTPPDAIS
ncbi:TPA: hypothetical protein R4S64_002492 [Kluyvera georgiana]|uniref:hypothetical protein n=1 Tax=Citrobacter sp. EC_71 TaxID=2584093 RepID=UPI001C6FFA06|nr:hypothetical protein [Citrobacter sp. EC_71]MBW9353905.1 hypothetical protein [Citrobacter sp. EC_71]HED1420477.1 hypothetical protein [Kluyvera georgiana]